MSDVLDPDALGALEQQQGHLLRSLDDLDAELAAGDLDIHDHRTLTDDYTRRLAEVTRAIDERRVAFGGIQRRLSTRQRWLTIGGVLVVAVAAGVLMAQASGFRSPTDSTTGDIRRSSAGLLAEADTLTREGRWPEAIEVYDEVLELSPANSEALTYRGWLTARLGDADAGLVDLGEAVAVDPAFADARVFRAILFDDEQRFDDAAAELAVLDTLDASDDIVALVEQSDLRASVAGGLLVERFGDGSTIDLDRIELPVADVVAAAGLLDSLDPVLAFRIYDAVLVEQPDNLTALVGKGRRLATDPDIFASSPDVAAEGLTLLDAAVSLAPDAADVRLYRAWGRSVQADGEGAVRDLALIDRSVLPDDLAEVYDRLGGS